MQTLDFVSSLHNCVSNSPNLSRVYIMLCKHGKRFLLLKWNSVPKVKYIRGCCSQKGAHMYFNVVLFVVVQFSPLVLSILKPVFSVLLVMVIWMPHRSVTREVLGWPRPHPLLPSSCEAHPFRLKARFVENFKVTNYFPQEFFYRSFTFFSGCAFSSSYIMGPLYRGIPSVREKRLLICTISCCRGYSGEVRRGNVF